MVYLLCTHYINMLSKTYIKTISSYPCALLLRCSDDLFEIFFLHFNVYMCALVWLISSMWKKNFGKRYHSFAIDSFHSWKVGLKVSNKKKLIMWAGFLCIFDCQFFGINWTIKACRYVYGSIFISQEHKGLVCCFKRETKFMCKINFQFTWVEVDTPANVSLCSGTGHKFYKGFYVAAFMELDVNLNLPNQSVSSFSQNLLGSLNSFHRVGHFMNMVSIFRMFAKDFFALFWRNNVSTQISCYIFWDKHCDYINS
jgi:hypothetical protein